MNINDNKRNEKIFKKIKGYTFKITSTTAANCPRLLNLVEYFLNHHTRVHILCRRYEVVCGLASWIVVFSIGLVENSFVPGDSIAI